MKVDERQGNSMWRTIISNKEFSPDFKKKGTQMFLASIFSTRFQNFTTRYFIWDTL